MDRANHHLGELARSELRRPGRRRARDEHDRFLLQRDRWRFDRSATAGRRTASSLAGPRSARCARRLRALPRDVAADGAVSTRASPRVGPDPHRSGAHVRQTPDTVPRHRSCPLADLAPRDAPAGRCHPRIEHRRGLDRWRERWVPRLPRLCDRNRFDPARSQPGDRGHRAGTGGDRPRQADRPVRCLPVGVRQCATAPRRGLDRSHCDLGPRELRGARPDRHLAGSPLGPCNLRGRARGLFRDRRPKTKSSPRSTTLAEGRISHGARNWRSLSSSARSSVLS